MADHGSLLDGPASSPRPRAVSESEESASADLSLPSEEALLRIAEAEADSAAERSLRKLSSQQEKTHLRNFLKKTQAFRGARLFGYIDAIYAIAATVMVVPTTTTTHVTNSTSYDYAQLAYFYDFLSLQSLLKVFIFWITFNFVTFAWVQHTLLLRHVRKVSRMVTVLTVGLVLGPCFLPMAATSAMDGFVAQFLVTANNPEAVIDVSVIFSTVIGLALPSTMLYYAVALLVCKLVFDRQFNEKIAATLPVTLSTGFIVLFALLNIVIISIYLLSDQENTFRYWALYGLFLILAFYPVISACRNIFCKWHQCRCCSRLFRARQKQRHSTSKRTSLNGPGGTAVAPPLLAEKERRGSTQSSVPLTNYDDLQAVEATMHVSSDEEEDPESMFRVATVPESKNLATITAGHCKNVLVQRRISKERLLTFTDGVFSIACTLLVLDLETPSLCMNYETESACAGAGACYWNASAIPSGNGTDQDYLSIPCILQPSDFTDFYLDYIQEIAPQMIAFVESFVLVNILWMRHHHLFAKMGPVVGDTVRFFNFQFLFFVSLVPESCKKLSTYSRFAPMNAVTIGVLAAILLAADLCLVIISVVQWRGSRRYFFYHARLAISKRLCNMCGYDVLKTLVFPFINLVIIIYAFVYWYNHPNGACQQSSATRYDCSHDERPAYMMGLYVCYFILVAAIDCCENKWLRRDIRKTMLAQSSEEQASENEPIARAVTGIQQEEECHE